MNGSANAFSRGGGRVGSDSNEPSSLPVFRHEAWEVQGWAVAGWAAPDNTFQVEQRLRGSGTVYRTCSGNTATYVPIIFTQ